MLNRVINIFYYAKKQNQNKSFKEMRKDLQIMIDELVRELKKAKVNVNDALVALFGVVDEYLVNVTWPGRQQWISQPLQETYLQTRQLGEEFYNKIDKNIVKQKCDILTALYLLCLNLGFTGKYLRLDHEAINNYKNKLRQALSCEFGKKTENQQVRPKLKPNYVCLGITIVTVVFLIGICGFFRVQNHFIANQIDKTKVAALQVLSELR